ncbi:MAG: DegT/DnrJ/EryC1/StrS family aminotransferase [Planctomycetota bacterium]
MQDHSPFESGTETSSAEVPTKDYARQYAALVPGLLEDIAETLLNDKPILGKAVQKFEAAFATAMGARHCVGLNSGTDALVLGMLQAGIGPGDEVITQANTFLATVSAIRMVGATPVLVDCLTHSPALNPDALSAAWSPRSRALLVVHMHGFATPMTPLVKFAEDYDLLLMEDCAQAHGALDELGKPVGTRGTFGAFSFHPSKNLGAFGDAGAFICMDEEMAAGVRVLRNLGKEGKYEQTRLGWNSKLDTLQATILLRRLPELAANNRRRRMLARRYDQGLADLSGLELPQAAARTTAVFHHYPVLHAKRDMLRAHLAQHGIGSSLHYPIPPHLQTAAKELGLGVGSFPQTERRAARGLSLPMASELREDEIDRVIAVVRGFCMEEGA